MQSANMPFWDEEWLSKEARESQARKAFFGRCCANGAHFRFNSWLGWSGIYGVMSSCSGLLSLWQIHSSALTLIGFCRKLSPIKAVCLQAVRPICVRGPFWVWGLTFLHTDNSFSQWWNVETVCQDSIRALFNYCKKWVPKCNPGKSKSCY